MCNISRKPANLLEIEVRNKMSSAFTALLRLDTETPRQHMMPERNVLGAKQRPASRVIKASNH